MDTLEGLVSAARGGDRAAYGEAVRRCWPAARAAARRRVRTEAEAGEAVQDAALRCWLALGQLRQPGAFPGWFVTAAVRCADNVARSARRAHKNVPSGVAERAAGGLGAAELAELGELRARVRDAVAALPPLQRAAVEAFYFGPNDYPAAARALRVPPGTLRRRLHDARRRLAVTLKGVA